jgi:hypothetical protein
VWGLGPELLSWHAVIADGRPCRFGCLLSALQYGARVIASKARWQAQTSPSAASSQRRSGCLGVSGVLGV